MSSKYQKKAIKVFEQYPAVKEVFVTSDNQGFLNENRAKLHAKSLKDKRIRPFTKNSIDVEEKTSRDLTVREIEEFARDLSDLPVLEEMLAEEKTKGDAARSTAIKALESRINTLKGQV